MEGEGRQTKAQMSNLALSIHTHVLTILPMSSGTIHRWLTNYIHVTKLISRRLKDQLTTYSNLDKATLPFPNPRPPPEEKDGSMACFLSGARTTDSTAARTDLVKDENQAPLTFE